MIKELEISLSIYSKQIDYTPTLLLDTHSPLPVYCILRKIPAYPFIRAYPIIKFQEKFPPTCLFEPPIVLET